MPSSRNKDYVVRVETHFKKIKRSGLLPAGVIFIGGGANTAGLVEFAKKALALPSRIGTTEIFGNAKTKLRDPAWLSTLAVMIHGKDSGAESSGTFLGVFKELRNSIKSTLRQLMP